MTIQTDTELDQQTRDELAPPCETGRDDNPAARILHWHITCDHLTPVDLYCVPCTARVVQLVNAADVLECRTCHATVRLLRVEPLR